MKLVVTGKSRNNGGNSVFRSVEDNSAIIVYGGKGGHVGEAGSGGDSPKITTGQNIQVINTVVNQGGNNANGGNGGAAIIDEYGKGGNYGKSGNGGYFSIVKVEPQVNYYTITVNSTSPVDATVVINGSDGSRVSGTGKQSLTVKEGTTVSYTVSRNHYIPVTKNNITVNSDINESVTLTRKTATFTLNINGNINNSSVEITSNSSGAFVGNEKTVTLSYNNTNHIEVEVYAGYTIEYKVTKAHYDINPAGVITVDFGDNNEERTVTLEKHQYINKSIRAGLDDDEKVTKTYTLGLENNKWKVVIGKFSADFGGIDYVLRANIEIRIYKYKNNTNFSTEFDKKYNGDSYANIGTFEIEGPIEKVEIIIKNNYTYRNYEIDNIYVELND